MSELGMKRLNKNVGNIRLLEPHLKAKVLNHLILKGLINRSTPILNEFTIDNLSRRADLALLIKGKLIAFEIKSEGDNLHRLEGQTQKYLEYFDKVIIVSSPKHIDKIIESVPKNVGIWEVTSSAIKIIQRGKVNLINDKYKLAELIKTNELLRLTKQLNLMTESKNRKDLKDALQKVPAKVLRDKIAEGLYVKFELVRATFWEKIYKKQIKAEHIELLSPHKNQKKLIQKNNEVTQSFWESKSYIEAQDFHLLSLSRETDEPIFGDVPLNIKKILSH